MLGFEALLGALNRRGTRRARIRNPTYACYLILIPNQPLTPNLRCQTKCPIPSQSYILRQ